MAKTVNIEEISERYAKALYALCVEQKTVDVVYSELKSLRNMEKNNPHLKVVFSSPVLSRKNQALFLEGLGEKMKLSQTTFNFLKLLSENRRLKIIEDIFRKWEEQIAKWNRQVIVSVESAKKLSDLQKKRLKEKIEHKLSKKVIFEEKIKPELIGGMKVKMENIMIDFSVQAQLSRLNFAMEGE